MNRRPTVLNRGMPTVEDFDQVIALLNALTGDSMAIAWFRRQSSATLSVS